MRGVPSKSTVRIPPEERLVNLVVALMATEQGLTKDTILSSVSGYREQSEAGASKDALCAGPSAMPLRPEPANTETDPSAPSRRMRLRPLSQTSTPPSGSCARPRGRGWRRSCSLSGRR